MILLDSMSMMTGKKNTHPFPLAPFGLGIMLRVCTNDGRVVEGLSAVLLSSALRFVE